VLKDWVRRSKIVLEKNPNHRGYELDPRYADPADPWDRKAIDALRGRRLPLLDRVEIYPIEEEQPRFLAFVNREHDLLDETPFEFIDQVLPNGRLAPGLARQGVGVFREEAPEITYDVFNLDHPVVGGYGPEKVALRRAMVLAHDRNQEIAIVRKGQALPAQSPVPPGVVGFGPRVPVAPAGPRPCAGQGAPRHVRLRRPQRRRLARAARRPPPPHRLQVQRRQPGQPAARRAVGEIDGRHRRAHLRGRPSSSSTS